MTRVRNSKKASGSNRSAVRSDSITSRAWQDAFSPLEPRTLLSDVQGPVGGPPSSMVASLTWHGSVVDVVRDSWIVTFDDLLGQNLAVERANEVIATLGIRAQDVKAIGRGGYAVFTAIDSFRESDVARVLSRVGGVRGVEPNTIYQPQAVPNDPLLSRQWGLINTGQEIPPQSGNFGIFGADIHASSAWDRNVGSENVIIAVIDTGIDLTHPDLNANIWRNPGEIANDGIDNDANGLVDDVTGYDFGDGDTNPNDPVGHGTEIAGIIGAVGNNNVGVSGVAWSVKMLPIKVARASIGNAIALDAVIAAHDYATSFIEDQGRNIVASNNSYGELIAQGFQAAEEAAIRRFTDTGASFVTAAGNQSANLDTNQFFPASYKQFNSSIIVVGATNNRDELSPTSNFGRTVVDIAAPGDLIFTTSRGGGFDFGANAASTSYASAFVAGSIALLKTAKPNASTEEIRRAITRGADLVDSLQNVVAAGGRLNVDRALRNILIAGPTVTGIFPGSVSSNVTSIVVSFSEDVVPPVLVSSLALVRSGGDGVFGNGNDTVVMLNQGMVSLNGSVLTVDLTSSFPSGLPNDTYRLTLTASGFQDSDGNFLNGTTATPLPADDEVYSFQVVDNSGAFEPNDSTAQATPVVFSTSGRAVFENALIGDGTQGGRDVDIYRFTLTGPGLIVATVDARSLPLPSTLDSVLSLYDSASLVPMNPVPVAINDNFNGLDSRVEYFVPTGGVYYLVVSGFGNDDFDPRAAGSGTDPGSVGDYRLTIDVAVDISDPVSIDATGLPLPILDPVVGVPQTLSSSISVFDSRRIEDLNVRMTITHPFVSDLQVRLRHHIEGQDAANDRIVSLVLARGGAGDDFVGTVFDDEALSSIVSAAAPFTGSFRPEQTLNRFDGQQASGVWTLEITDTRAPSTGTLVAWGLDFTLQNNVFGPFELNDTIGLVPTPILNGVGAATRDAFIGDGAFGLRDVDLFRIVAPAGTTITATVNVPFNPGDPIGGPSSNRLDTVLRLFDATGNELVLDNREDTQNSSLSFVVDPGGVFFIGVSGASNTAYSILSGGSGTQTDATGDYRLTVQVAGGISNGTVITTGSASGVTLGVNADGSIGVPTGSVPANSLAQPAGLALAGNEFILARSQASESFFGATYNGFSFQNSGPAGRSDLEVSIAEESDPTNRRVVISGLFRDLRVQRTFSYGVNDHFIAVDVTLTNTSLSDISDVAWVEAFNPQTGLNRQTTVARTVNNVDNATGRLVTASFIDNGFPGGLTVGLGTGALPSGLRATAAVQDLESIRDPFQVLDNATPDPDTSGGDTGVEADRLIALAFGTNPTERIGSNQSVSFRYFIFLGASVDEVETAYATLNADTGTGHLVQDPQGSDPLRGYDADTGQSSLPYAIYYPEGYANDRASTFVPIINASESPARVVVIARYENGVRDQVLYDSATDDIDGDSLVDGTIAPHSRTGLTITTPAKYADQTTLVRRDEPYSLEVRSSQPVAANLSHFDFGVSTGEAFSNTTSSTWTFGEGYFGEGVNDFVVFYNPNPTTVRVTLTIYPETGAAAFTVPAFDLQGLRRGGWSLANLLEGRLPSGTPFGMRLISQGPIVAALTHFDTNLQGGFGVLGTPSLGSTTGATPEGQLGISATSEFVTILNTNSTAANVNFTFFFENGSAYRHNIVVAANRRSGFSVGALDNFPIGQQAYSITYESDVPVAMTLPSFAQGEATGSEFSAQAATTWLFADGFRPLAGDQVTEYLRLYNPTTSALTVEITMDFNDGGTETFRRTLQPSAANEFNIHDFVTGFRRTEGTVPGVGSFYGIRIRAAQPIVAYMAHFDANFFGGFGTLGMPIGVVGTLG